MTGGQFVTYGDYRIWVWDTEVDCLWGGVEMTYEKAAKVKFDSGFINTFGVQG